jgi:hypothetical protein
MIKNLFMKSEYFTVYNFQIFNTDYFVFSILIDLIGIS